MALGTEGRELGIHGLTCIQLYTYGRFDDITSTYFSCS